LLLILASAFWGILSGCDAPLEGQQRIDEAKEAAPQVSSNTIQTAITGLLLSAGTTELDDSYDEVDTWAEVRSVTAGNGAHNLGDHLSASYPLGQAFDISRDGLVTVD